MLYDPGNRWHMANVGRLTEAVLFDRDGTLVRDVPYNGDPDAVVVMPGAREALDRLRAGVCGSAWSPTSPASPGGG